MRISKLLIPKAFFTIPTSAFHGIACCVAITLSFSNSIQQLLRLLSAPACVPPAKPLATHGRQAGLREINSEAQNNKLSGWRNYIPIF
jgi:hypothetical protein